MRAYPKGGGARATRQRHDPQGLLTTDEAVDETRIRALFFGDRAAYRARVRPLRVRDGQNYNFYIRKAKVTRKVIGVSSLKIVSRISGILMWNFDEYTLASTVGPRVPCWLFGCTRLRLPLCAPRRSGLSGCAGACVATGHRDATCLPDRTERKPRRRRPSSQSLPPGLGGHAARARDLTQMRRRTND